MRNERSERSESGTNVILWQQSSRALYRQTDDCYRISHCIVTRTFWERVWASINNWL